MLPPPLPQPCKIARQCRFLAVVREYRKKLKADVVNCIHYADLSQHPGHSIKGTVAQV
jgi:hypothetical protein